MSSIQLRLVGIVTDEELPQQQPDALSFMVARAQAKTGRSEFRCWGISSDALALFAVAGGDPPTAPGRPEHEPTEEHPYPASWHGAECSHSGPYDPSDLAACERTYLMAPDDLRERMAPVLLEFQRWVLDGINRHGQKIARGYAGRATYRGKVVA